MSKTLTLVLAAVVLAGCYSRILPEPPQARQGVLAVAGAPNARDLGGLSGHGGGTVKWGMLVRSGDLSMLTPRDSDFLFGPGRMGMETVVDLRCVVPSLDFGDDGDLEVVAVLGERDRAPSRMPDALLWTGMDTDIPDLAAFDGLGEIILDRDLDFDSVVLELLRWYRDLVTLHRDRYLGFFSALLAAEGPVLFHCSTGKDRAGVAAALLLMALGVSDEDIVADYMLSLKLVHESLFPVVPFIRAELGRDLREKRSDALILVQGTPDETAPILEGLRQDARREVLRGMMRDLFHGILSADPGITPEEAAARAGEEMAGIVAGLDAGSLELDAIDAAFDLSLDRMLELGGIPDDDFDDWVDGLAWKAGNNVKPFLSVFPQWIEAALAEVRDSWGGIEGFLEDLSPDMSGADVVARLRELYLTPGPDDEGAYQ